MYHDAISPPLRGWNGKRERERWRWRRGEGGGEREREGERRGGLWCSEGPAIAALAPQVNDSRGVAVF